MMWRAMFIPLSEFQWNRRVISTETPMEVPGGMSNAIAGGIPKESFLGLFKAFPEGISMEALQWYCGEVLFENSKSIILSISELF